VKASKLCCFISLFVFVAFGCRKKPTETTTALHQAARAGSIERVQSLVTKGADINVRDIGGLTPLDEAARRGHKDIIELLKKKQTGLNVKSER
jgi:ankyrin repeat protein